MNNIKGGYLSTFSLSFGCHIEEKTFAACGDWFGAIVNLLLHLQLLMYDKTILFLIGSTNVYGIIFYQVYLPQWLNIPFFFF